MVTEINSSAGTNELINQAFTDVQNLHRPELDAARQQNIIQHQRQAEQMQALTEFADFQQERTETRLDAGQIIDFAGDLRDTFSQLQETAEALQDQSPVDQPVFAERSVEISGSGVVTGEAEAGANPQSLDLEVTELAQAQEMQGVALPADDPGAIAAGEFEFAVEQGDIEETITIEAGEEDTPQEIMRTAAEEIAVTEAEVEADVLITGDDEVFMEVRAEDAGEAGEFELRDITGDFIADELDMSMEQAAAEADIAIEDLTEGEDFFLQGNVLQLQEGQVELELQETGAAEIEIAPDMDEIGEAVRDFTAAIDNVQQFIAEQPASPTLEEMGEQLDNLLAEREGDLARLGIEIGPEAEINIDEDRLEAVLTTEPDLVEEVFGEEGAQRGLAREADRTAEQALTRPLTEFMEVEEAAVEEQEIAPPEDFEIYNRSGQISPMDFMGQGDLINIVL